MSLDIELIDPAGNRYKTAPHRFSWRSDPGAENTSTETWVNFSNMDDLLFYCIAPDNRGGELVFPPASKVEALDDDDFAEDLGEVSQLLRGWAKEHPEGRWRAL